MEDFEGKLNSILGDPEMMSQIMALAQQLGQSSPDPAPPPAAPPPRESGEAPVDIAAIARLAGAAGNMGVDKNQQALLRALDPYISRERIGRLEKAMRAAKLASFATSFLGSGILSPTGG